MYHDTIRINFSGRNTISFNYNFFISKNQYDKFSPIKYGVLLSKFTKIGFDTKYLKFNDIQDDNTIVYCTYNYQSNFEIFFLAYNKLIKDYKFNITFEYGNIINGKFYPNNINFFSTIWFVEKENISGNYMECIIKGKYHQKALEQYQIIDKNTQIISMLTTTCDQNFEQNFFENYNVKVYLRKYKLSRLKEKFE